jgi:hypothetical protein
LYLPLIDSLMEAVSARTSRDWKTSLFPASSDSLGFPNVSAAVLLTMVRGNTRPMKFGVAGEFTFSLPKFKGEDTESFRMFSTSEDYEYS